jgi:hypothetical protein
MPVTKENVGVINGAIAAMGFNTKLRPKDIAHFSGDGNKVTSIKAETGVDRSVKDRQVTSTGTSSLNDNSHRDLSGTSSVDDNSHKSFAGTSSVTDDSDKTIKGKSTIIDLNTTKVTSGRQIDNYDTNDYHHSAGIKRYDKDNREVYSESKTGNVRNEYEDVRILRLARMFKVFGVQKL